MWNPDITILLLLVGFLVLSYIALILRCLPTFGLENEEWPFNENEIFELFRRFQHLPVTYLYTINRMQGLAHIFEALNLITTFYALWLFGERRKHLFLFEVY